MLVILFKHKFETTQDLASSAFHHSLSHPCTNIFTHFTNNIPPEIISATMVPTTQIPNLLKYNNTLLILG